MGASTAAFIFLIEFIIIAVSAQFWESESLQLREKVRKTVVEHVGDHGNRKIWVYCTANMRVSAFTYRYRMAQLNA